MKALLISVLLAILPIAGWADGSVYIGGYIDPLPGQDVVLTVSPGNSSYTYEWDCDGNWENQEKRFDFSISGNQITISPKEMKVQMLRLYCSVYDENGSYVGQGEAEIIWYWRR